MRGMVSLVLGLVLGLAWPVAASALLIDDFATGAGGFVISVGGSNPAPDSETQVGAGILGGERALILTRTAGLGIAATDVSLSENGVYSFTTGAGVTAEGQLSYDGSSGPFDPGGLGGIDVTDGGASTFVRFQVRSDQAATLRITFLSGDIADTLFAEVVVPATSTIGPFQTIDIPFASLMTAGAGANLTSVGAVLVDITGPASLDLQIDQIATVPEPGTLMLLLTGILILAGGRRAAA